MYLRRDRTWLAPGVDAPAAGSELRHWRQRLSAPLAADTMLMLKIAACALGWRVVSAFAAFLSNVVFPLDQPAPFTVTQRAHYFWDALARFDSGWYFGIARNGYSYVEGGRNNLAFFPAYPVSMGYLGYFMGGGQANYYIAGLIISWVTFAGAMVMLYRLARLDVDSDTAARACVYTAVFPFAFFYGAVYPSSLFLFLSVLAFHAFRQGHWVTGAVAGALVTCTRVNGILVLPALALLVWTKWRHDPPALRRALVALALVPSGLIAYSAYTYALSGSLVEWAMSIQRWNYSPGRWPGEVFTIMLGSVGNLYEFLTKRATGPYDFLNGMAAFGGVIAIPFVWKKFGAPYAIYIALNLALPLSSGEFEGLGRYTSVLFPLFLLLGTYGRFMTHAGILATFAMFYMLCQALFVTLHPLY